MLRILVNDLDNLNRQIFEMDMQISKSCQNNEYARIIDTIPSIGKYGALSIAAKIDDVDRFPMEDNIFSYAGLVPRIYQSGPREYNGRITKGDSFLK